MLSLRKKSEAAPRAAAWHTNFRNFERLPDTKAVRTTFFINGAAVFAAIIALLYFSYQEFSRAALAEQIADWEAQIAADQPGSTAAIAAFKRFQAEEKKVAEVAAFTERQLVLSSFLHRVGATLPPEIALNYVDYRVGAVTLRGGVRGAPNEASGTASAYVAQLQADPEIGPRFAAITLTSLARNGATGELNFEAVLKFPVPDAPKGAKKKK